MVLKQAEVLQDIWEMQPNQGPWAARCWLVANHNNFPRTMGFVNKPHPNNTFSMDYIRRALIWCERSGPFLDFIPVLYRP